MRAGNKNIIASALAIFCIFGAQHLVLAQSTQTQLLPPTTTTSSSACGGASQILFYSGLNTVDGTGKPTSAINCGNATVDASGVITTPGLSNFNGGLNAGTNISLPAAGAAGFNGGLNAGSNISLPAAGAAGFNGGLNVSSNVTLPSTGVSQFTDGLSIGGSGTLLKKHAEALIKFEAAKCGANQAITQDLLGNVNCVSVTDIIGVGTVTVPSCAPYQQLYFNGTGFVCNAIPSPAIPAIPSVPNCPPGQLVTGDGSSFSCITPQSPTGGAPLYVYNVNAVGAAAYNAAIQNAKTNFCLNIPGVSTTYCNNLYSGCYWDSTGYDGSTGGTSQYGSTVVTTNVVCLGAFCEGLTGKYPSLTSPSGECAPGDTPASTGNPACDALGRPLLGVNCLSTY